LNPGSLLIVSDTPPQGHSPTDKPTSPLNSNTGTSRALPETRDNIQRNFPNSSNSDEFLSLSLRRSHSSQSSLLMKSNNSSSNNSSSESVQDNKESNKNSLLEKSKSEGMKLDRNDTNNNESIIEINNNNPNSNNSNPNSNPNSNNNGSKSPSVGRSNSRGIHHAIENHRNGNGKRDSFIKEKVEYIPSDHLPGQIVCYYLISLTL
jgi:hypothetical protein